MGILATAGKILGGGVIGQVKDIIDDAHLSKQEKLEGITTLMATEMQAKKEVLTAELNQGDKYTKRARPTVVYFGLVVIGLNHVILPWAAHIAALFRCSMESVEVAAACAAASLPPIQLPEEFWWTWGGICSVWVIGRSAEKYGVRNAMTKLISG